MVKRARRIYFLRISLPAVSATTSAHFCPIIICRSQDPMTKPVWKVQQYKFYSLCTGGAFQISLCLGYSMKYFWMYGSIPLVIECTTTFENPRLRIPAQLTWSLRPEPTACDASVRLFAHHHSILAGLSLCLSHLSPMRNNNQRSNHFRQCKHLQKVSVSSLSFLVFLSLFNSEIWI